MVEWLTLIDLFIHSFIHSFVRLLTLLCFRDESTTGKKYPAMTEEEIEEWLAHIPVFAVTDSNGAGVVLKPDGEQSVFYFFMSPMMANATLTTLKTNNPDMDLKISAFSLGKIWFKILNADKETEIKVRKRKMLTVVF
jgi:Tic22-like family.